MIKKIESNKKNIANRQHVKVGLITVNSEGHNNINKRVHRKGLSANTKENPKTFNYY